MGFLATCVESRETPMGLITCNAMSKCFCVDALYHVRGS